jgi:DNA-binding NarL/FixJ family response regulator
MPEPLRVLIAEDNVLMRAGIEALLGDEPDIDVVGTCTRYDELVRAALQLRPDVVVTDIRMPPGFSDEGVRAAAQLREQAPAIGVVLLSQFLDPAYLLALIEPSSERRGYLLKDRVATPGQLATAVRTVATGGSYIDPLAVNTLVGAGRRRSASPLADLTVRELETLAEVAEGRSNAAIAARFRISERAVEKHIGSVFTKLGILEDGAHNRRVKAVLVYLSR